MTERETPDPDKAIAAALRAAERFYLGHPGSDGRMALAGAITAFLRALPPGLFVGAIDAPAVERANAD